jgi:hypothetical protein
MEEATTVNFYRLLEWDQDSFILANQISPLMSPLMRRRTKTFSVTIDPADYNP